MVQTLKTYLRRLTNLTARNRSLVLTALPAEQFLDVHDLDFLDGRPSFDVVAQLIAQRPAVPLCDVLDPRYERLNAVSGRLKRIARTEAFIRQERGAEDLYVGYPFVRGKFADGTVVRGPLVFFPVTLEVVRQKWVLCRRGEPPFLNPSFLLAYSHFNGVKLPDDLLEKTFAEPTDRDALTFRTQLYEFLKQSPVVLNFNPDLFSPHLLPFERVTKSDLDQLEKTGQLKLYPQAVLGIFPQAGSYLVPDYEAMILRSEEREARSEEKMQSDGLGKLFSSLLASRSSLPIPKEADSLLPFAVDASQEAAIQRVKAGESLVIQGPPGTGKSQVIANLMADFAARGKRVLLVCQKRAALDTVYARLQQIGMADFAALIHDFQHDRAPLYARLAGQIERLDEYRRQNGSLDAIFLQREFTQTAHRIGQLTGQLQEFHDALFDESVCGASAKELYLTSSPDGGRVDLGALYNSFHFGQLDEFLRRLDRWEAYETRLAGSPWHPERVDFSRFTTRDLPELETVVEDVPAFARHLAEQTTALLGQPLAWADAVALDEARDRWQQALRLADDAAVWPLLQNALAGRWTADFFRWLDAQRAALDATWRRGVVGASLPPAALPRFHQTVRAALDARRSVWGWWFFKEKEPLRAEAARHGLTLSMADLQRLDERVENRSSWEKMIVEVETKAGIRLVNDDPAATQAAFETFHQYATRAAEARQALGKKDGLLYRLARQTPERAVFRRVVEALLASVQPIPERLRRWRAALAEGPLTALLRGTVQPEILKTALRRDFELLREMDGLKTSFSRTEWEVLKNLTRAAGRRAGEVFLNSLRLAWLDDLETRFPVLRSVSGLQMAQWETELQAAIERKQALSREILLLRLREQTYENVERNRLNNVVTYRDLKHQVTKKRSIWPVRKLLSELAGEVFPLTPCWLASPESVSALFPLAGTPPFVGATTEIATAEEGAFFDLVIFDEASQCYAEQGIPALARGQQVVVAGDRHQLQPSDVYRVRFEDDTDDNPDLEVDSLLDLAARYLPQTALRGHYRSRSLDLIQFSNRHFYKNSLQLLPDFAEINRREPAIRYLHVQGHWQDQQNGVEARAVLDLIRDLAHTEPALSVGVVTFNYRQQGLIQDLLEANATAERNEQRATGNEPLFIKNIENVQGDERDVIIFSVGYAPRVDTPDQQGRVSAQFGSLNAKGGENRLNVAVTRARRRVYVVCSLWPEQLDVENTLNEGPKLLKAYLRFARDVSEGHFQPQPAQESTLRGRPLLKEKLRAEDPDLREELPFADLTEKKNEAYGNLLLTDDEAFFASLSPKEPHAYLPLTLRAKGWPFRRVWSREWWQNGERP